MRGQYRKARGGPMEKSGHTEKIKPSSIVIDSTGMCIGIKERDFPSAIFLAWGTGQMIALTELRRIQQRKY